MVDNSDGTFRRPTGIQEVLDYGDARIGPGRDRDEALRYFDEVVRYYAEDVLNGGVDAIHGFDINFDESTPHIQIMADTLVPDPKHDGKLRCESSQMWGSHRDVTELRADKDGVVREMNELPQNKMSRYQKGLRDRMVSLGYPVEADYDLERGRAARRPRAPAERHGLGS